MDSFLLFQLNLLNKIILLVRKYPDLWELFFLCLCFSFLLFPFCRHFHIYHVYCMSVFHYSLCVISLCPKSNSNSHPNKLSIYEQRPPKPLFRLHLFFTWKPVLFYLFFLLCYMFIIWLRLIWHSSFFKVLLGNEIGGHFKMTRNGS